MAPTSAYSANPVKPFTTTELSNGLILGNHIGLITAVQARNNARLVFAGSLDLFSNKYFDKKDFANNVFADAVTKWGFQQSGVLRMTNVKHHREDGSQPAKMLSDAKRGDLPITLYPDAEVARDSLVRTMLSHDEQGHFAVTFQAPDVYGIFLFRVLYRRLGLSTIFTTTQVLLRPCKHDEYERIIPAAYPSYASAFSVMVGVFLFSVYFLFYDGKQ
ncbi:hypothetical protein PsorP6_014148 [Peronosclerospora sorghi]|uniref:Uncharacterized protein n=1 Tax=Peronosclerospora sorghi TaxID=230839 RepID=A0ACC0VGX6_9STRA|nr:hypothetical protein PsorP6_014148 [Peronosclerospora sorghi]